MKRVILAFFGTLVAGFVLFVVGNHLQPVADPGRFGETIGGLAVLFAIAAFYILVLGIHQPVRFFGAVSIPGPVAVGASLFGAAFYLCLFIRSHLPGREITVDTSGIVLPRRGRVTWDQITEVKLCNAGYIEFLCTVRMGLNGGRRVNIAWWQTGCEPRKLYEAIQACFEEHERRAKPDHPSSELRDGSLHPPIGVHPG